MLVRLPRKESLAAKSNKDGSRKWACREYLEFLYKAHDDDETPNYKVYYQRYGSTQGRGGC